MPIPPSTCLTCGCTFLPKYRVTDAYWTKRKYCSPQCSIKGSIGKPHIHNPATREQHIARFWAKVRKGKPDDCWEWIGARSHYNYGKMSTSRTPYKEVKAHRFSYEIHNGPITDPALCVCHTCDNPPCCNPSHLWLGTRADNNKDKMQKGRLNDRKGENNGRAKITWKDAEDIRVLSSEGLSQTEIAKMYGVTQTNIGRIVLGKSWVRP